MGGPAIDQSTCTGPCEVDYTPFQANYTVARGGNLTLEWPRNSHAGGFIRISWIPRGSGVAETHAMFDENVFEYGCFETTCWADQDANGTGGNPGGLGSDDNGPDGLINPCTFQTKVPLHLEDGSYTMQWAWYGGGGGFNGDYYSCVNFMVSGGAAVGPQLTAKFIGGDVSSPDQCKFWTTDRLHYCTSEPCSAYCTNATSPVGSCGVTLIGAPYFDPNKTQVNASSSDSDTVIMSSTAPDVINDFFNDTSSLKVYFPIDAATFDVSFFVYDMSNILGINQEAFTRVSLRLDISKLLATVVEFTIANATFSNATDTVIDPTIVTNAVSNMITQQPPALVEAFYVANMRAFDENDFPITISACAQMVPSAVVVLAGLLFSLVH